MRSTAEAGITFGSYSDLMTPAGARRLPLISRSVASLPMPRRLMPEMRVVFAAPSCAPPSRLSSAPRLMTCGRDRAISLVVARPVSCISARSSPTTGDPALATPRMLLPVTTTSSTAGASTLSCACAPNDETTDTSAQARSKFGPRIDPPCR